MKQLRDNSGYSLLELLLSTGIFMMSITLILMGITIYSRDIHEQMEDSSIEIESIRFLHQFSKDVSESNLSGDSFSVVTFTQGEACSLIQSWGARFDSITGVLNQTEIEYQFRDKYVLRTEALSEGGGGVLTRKFTLPGSISKKLCLITSYIDGQKKVISVGDVSSFKWSENVDLVIVELGQHTRTLTQSEFVD